MDQIPTDIAAAYYSAPGATCQPLGDGIINLTYLITEASGHRTVLQCLSSIFDERVIADFAAISNHLVRQGWEVPVLIEAADGTLFQTDKDGRLWRAMSFIASDVATSQADPAAIGALLGRLHSSLKELDYKPQFIIPHFHDTPYFAARLAEVAGQLTTPELQTMAADFIQAYAVLTPPKALPPQLLHGDPKLSNVLFRNGQPFTYIDFDTLMYGQIWIDLGDLLRSLASQAFTDHKAMDRTELAAVIASYRKTVYANLAPDTFEAWGIAALQQLTLELGMRYLIDIIEDYYFVWQNKGFASRTEYSSHKAALQWRIFQSFNA